MTEQLNIQSASKPIDIYPYLLKPRAREMVWGGQNLARLFDKPIPPDQRIGETWEAWEGCDVENGAMRGVTLGELIARDSRAILGKDANGSRFPLLFKFIDAQDDLSVQVHPDDSAASEMEHQPFGKTEAWYILDAEPGARIIHGFRRQVNTDQIRALLAEDRLEEVLATVPVQRGDVVYVPAGTVHAIMRGIVLAEIQENSDITYRLYDWGRGNPNRPLHIEQSIQVLDLGQQIEHKIQPLVIHHAALDHEYLVACRFFSLELLQVKAATEKIALNKFNIISIIEGEAEIASDSAPVLVKRGQTILLPANLFGFRILPRGTPCRILRMYVPDLRADVIEPLKNAGFGVTDILQLGAPSLSQNDLQSEFGD